MLRPYGFTDEASRYSTFYRQIGPEVFHIICPSRRRDGDNFEILMYPTSPVIDPSFASRFPDELGVPTNLYPYLGENGIGYPQLFNCRYEDDIRRRFEKSIKLPLLTAALPYLDPIKTIADMIPLLKHQGPLGFALDHVGRHEEVRQVLTSERDRLAGLDTTAPSIIADLKKIDEILSRTEPPTNGTVR